ncbi:hypothetical protein B9479_002588 [Cryptococcus floricola]|uniref:ubiquitinyl hydrolase 1 n=1 Tax=Cryptococcus floricola TaxID=2591691 RepID=A0A5D3B0P5_9TREE|nr:hypothetical protein B9479_002588 [Cryptococcus floricola]
MSAPAPTASPGPPPPAANAPSHHLKPVGIRNEQNTCYLNSTFQALSATAPLTALLSQSPLSPLRPLPDSILPSPEATPAEIPSLHPETLEPPLYKTLPLTRAFTSSLHEGYRRKDDGHRIDAGKSEEPMSLRALLRAISKKHIQYDGFDQQDAHEFLRHLLNGMEQEEVDVIKVLRPKGQTKEEKRRIAEKAEAEAEAADSETVDGTESGLQLDKGSTVDSPASPARLDPVANAVPQENDVSIVTGQAIREEPTTAPAKAQVEVKWGNGETAVEPLPEVADGPHLVPFVDVIFGGLLASVVVCEKCKALSHTYEGFLDISLSVLDSPRVRKRDKVKAFANRFKPRGTSNNRQGSPDIGQPPSPMQLLNNVVSDEEMSDSEVTAKEESLKKRRESLAVSESDNGDGASGIGRASSTKKFGGLFRKKNSSSRPGSSSSSLNALPLDSDKSSRPHSPHIPHSTHQPHAQPHHHHNKRQAKPTAAQAAYIARILAPAQGQDANDPIARLRAAQSGTSTPVEPTKQESGLERCLRDFTSVEVLEGQNAFACQKCWRIKHGRYDHHEATVKEEDESGQTPAMSTSSGPPVGRRPDARSTLSENSVTTMSSLESGTIPISPRVAPPSISIQTDVEDQSRRGRGVPLSSTASCGSYVRARSPLGRPVDEEETLVEDMSHVNMDQSFTSQDSNSGSFVLPSETGQTIGSDDEDAESDTASESDGLSDSETESEEEHDGKKKKKSKHFVMGRAFKRFLISKPPPVMVFHMKRFKQISSYSASFSSLRKIDDFVSFPEQLDIAPYLAPNRKDYKMTPTPNGAHAPFMDWPHPMQGPATDPVLYKLYAVVVHIGDMVSGHYIAYVLVDPEVMFGKEASKTVEGEDEQAEEPATPRTLPQDRKGVDRRVWAFCSDEVIREVNVEEVLRAKAYLCFYEKEN